MVFEDLEHSQLFMFLSDKRHGFNFLKESENSFWDVDNMQLIVLNENEPHLEMLHYAPVEPWMPKEERNDQVVDLFSPEAYYPYDSVDDNEFELVENVHFPDYELIVTKGDDIIRQLTIHCWRTGDEVGSHRASVWIDGKHVLDTVRSDIEDMVYSNTERLKELLEK